VIFFNDQGEAARAATTRGQRVFAVRLVDDTGIFNVFAVARAAWRVHLELWIGCAYSECALVSVEAAS
jgi:hypothetical protein